MKIKITTFTVTVADGHRSLFAKSKRISQRHFTGLRQRQSAIVRNYFHFVNGRRYNEQNYRISLDYSIRMTKCACAAPVKLFTFDIN